VDLGIVRIATAAPTPVTPSRASAADATKHGAPTRRPGPGAEAPTEVDRPQGSGLPMQQEPSDRHRPRRTRQRHRSRDRVGRPDRKEPAASHATSVAAVSTTPLDLRAVYLNSSQSKDLYHQTNLMHQIRLMV
jgi:hypothetical protein